MQFVEEILEWTGKCELVESRVLKNYHMVAVTCLDYEIEIRYSIFMLIPLEVPFSILIIGCAKKQTKVF